MGSWHLDVFLEKLWDRGWDEETLHQTLFRQRVYRVKYTLPRYLLVLGAKSRAPRLHSWQTCPGMSTNRHPVCHDSLSDKEPVSSVFLDACWPSAVTSRTEKHGSKDMIVHLNHTWTITVYPRHARTATVQIDEYKARACTHTHELYKTL